MNVREKGLYALSFFLAYTLSVFPMGSWASYRPAWVWWVLVFWLIKRPKWVPVEAAFGMGIILDELTGTLLGTQALAFMITVYVWNWFAQRGWTIDRRHQLIFASLLWILYEGLLHFLKIWSY